MSLQAEALRRYIAGARPEEHAPRADAPVVLVAAGKGGVGTSHVAALLALSAARSGARVLVVDGDEQLGVQHLLLGAQALGPSAAPHDVPGVPGMRLVAGGGADGHPLSPAERHHRFRRASDHYAGCDLVVVDAGARLESVQAAARAGAARLLVVTTADRLALAASYALTKVLDGGRQLNELPVELLLNRQGDAEGWQVFRHVETAAERFLRREIAFAGAVPDDAELRTATEHGVPLQQLPPTASASLALDTVALRLLSAFGSGAPLAATASGRP